jgi:hypothetical protein
MSWQASVHCFLLLGLAELQQIPVRVSPAVRTRQIIVATIGFVAMIAIPVIAFYYARKRWRP